MTTRALQINTTTGDVERTAELVEAADVATEPTMHGIPRADAFGKIARGWIPLLDIDALPTAQDGEVSASKVVRADDSRLGNPAVGGDLSGTAAAALVVRLHGRAFANASPADGDVLIWNDQAQQWEPTAIAVGNGLTIEDGVTSVANVARINVPPGSLVDEGDHVVSLAIGGGSGSASPGALLYLFAHYR